ncbi:MAG: hypothetical protein N3D20_02840 [Candidatus Pacearchaeota archaeon]|nr:hypothetical protein [Candidatus Pacearchaeota archaeon]
MKLSLFVDEDINLEIKLDKKEVEKLVEVFEKMGLKKGKVYNLWGDKIKNGVWIDVDDSLMMTLCNSCYSDRFLNDFAEKPLLFDNEGGIKVNLTILRLFDINRRKVRIKLDKFLTILQFKKIVNLLKEAVEKIFNSTIYSIKVEIENKKIKK